MRVQTIASLQRSILRGYHPIADLERTPRCFMPGIWRVIEHDLETVLYELGQELFMSFGSVGSKVDTLDACLNQIHSRREDNNFRLLDIGLEQIDMIERTQYVSQRDGTHELDIEVELGTSSWQGFFDAGFAG